jgi:type IX secretion system PorP/SprF family membrane protein
MVNQKITTLATLSPKITETRIHLMQRMRQFILLILFFNILVISAYAQQEPQFTQYMYFNMLTNPGVAGNENAICAVGADRMQWVGFKDADGNKVSPETFFITVNSPVKILRGGLSGSIMQDKIGFEKTIAVKVGYAYQRALGFGKLGIGTQLEFNNRSIDFSKFKPAGEDPLLNQLSGKESDMLIDFSLGLFYRVEGSYYIGLSGVHLLQNKGSVLASGTGGDLRMRLDRTFFLTGGYDFVFPGNPSFELLPSAMIKSNLSSLQMDISAILKYKDQFWGGLAYRLQDAVCVILGVQYKDFKIGYSYDINVSKMKLPIGGGTHEIMLGYCFKLEMEKGRKSYKNTRFL